MRPTRRAAAVTVTAAMAAATIAAGCGSPAAPSAASPPAARVTLRLGFLENITHASALVGIRQGYFSRELGPRVTLRLFPFSTGTQEATALLAGQLDAAYVGPNPAISTWQKSAGQQIWVISGSASGGAELVVKPGITRPSQLRGQKLATPSLGNTQDVALRHWLKAHGLTATVTGGGDVPVTPMTPNSSAVLAFRAGAIAGGWEPAPYDAEMIAAGGHVLVNEASLWPRGQFTTTVLVAAQSFVKARPAVIDGLLRGQIDANSFISTSKARAERAANAELAAVSGKSLDPSIVAASFDQITFTNDPVAPALIADAGHAVSAGLLRPVAGLPGMFRLGPLNKLLTADGKPRVSS